MSNAHLLQELLARPVAFHPVFSRLAGGATAGLYLSQLFYWTPRASHSAGFIYKSAPEFELETTLTEGEQRSARKALERLGLLETALAHKHFKEIDAFDRRLCYRLNIELLYKLICHRFWPAEPVVVDLGNSQMHALDSQMHLLNKQIEPSQTPVHKTESTSESTYKNHHHNTATNKGPKQTERSSNRGSGGGGVDFDVEELIEALAWELVQAGNKIRNRGGWEKTIRAAISKNGFSPADVATIKSFRQHQARIARAAKTNALPQQSFEMSKEAIAIGDQIRADLERKRARAKKT